MIALGQVVTALEILRSYAEAYVQGSHALGLLSTAIANDEHEGHDIRKNQPLLERLYGHLDSLLRQCKHLPMTSLSIRNLMKILNDRPSPMFMWTQTHLTLLSCIADIHQRLEDELSLSLFFMLPIEKARYFDSPFQGWEDVLIRFPNATTDVEEMSKCFALSRYAASVFHSVAVIEVGLLSFGQFLSVSDPHSGWTAVTKKLGKIIDTKYDLLSDAEKNHRPFLEQMHGVITALQSAWRNKISHAQGRLTLMKSDFSPDVAEEIMIASRSFMRRLTIEMPAGTL